MDPDQKGQKEQLEKQRTSWKKCVGNENYFEASSETEPLKAFKQIIGFEEEVGRSSSVTPGLFK
ncbi:hypothetical protein [Aggregatibacter actinomycetemcomitans]|uniref:hypothetical protein n=1 Tax=Aggregatibacter actinomycetemcomitans TaxID=714 RepID=UPI00197C9C10|nr:hypothetical protein [Aggregatibacter actinomycetemcomitans]MBN6062942.1 hypothetical protein [Aggregatibacter actinomycetemcomitans]MBN6082872.1 hypothetical protein [Aggregatibacter actinomycetemcomitans]